MVKNLKCRITSIPPQSDQLQNECARLKHIFSQDCERCCFSFFEQKCIEMYEDPSEYEERIVDLVKQLRRSSLLKRQRRVFHTAQLEYLSNRESEIRTLCARELQDFCRFGDKVFVDSVTADMLALADSFQKHIDRYDQMISESKPLEEQAREELLGEGVQCGASLRIAMLLFSWLFAMRKGVCLCGDCGDDCTRRLLPTAH